MADKKPLYVNRRVLNAKDIIDWARTQGFASTLKPKDLHVTVVYSKAPVDWQAVPDSFDHLRLRGGPRSVAQLGDKGAIVLKFDSAELRQRWEAFRDVGASWDYDDYRPHITLTYNAGEVDISRVEPYRGVIELGQERFEPLDEGWPDKIEHQSTALAKSYSLQSPDHAHYMDAIREKLAGLAVTQVRIDGQRRAIRQAADARLEVVQREIESERAKAHLHDDAGARYRALILERGRLHRLLS